MTRSHSAGVRAICLIFLLLAFVAPASAQIVISQVYGGGGNAGAPFDQDFVELFNAGDEPQSLDGWSVQYTSAAGVSWGNQLTELPNVILQPGQYFLVGLAFGAGTGDPLPTPDTDGDTNMAAGSGKVLLASTTIGQTGACPSGADVVDLVPYGNNANCEPRAPQLSNTLAAVRGDNGCAITGDPSADFDAAAPDPRNTQSDAAPCGDGGGGGDGLVVISQVYGGGGNAGAPFNQDFVELFNTGTGPQSLDGWSIQYTSATGDSWGNQITELPDVTLAPGQYFLVGLASGATGDPLPTPDATGDTNMAGGAGKVLLASTTTGQTDACPAGGDVVDLVPYGDNANCEPKAPQLSNTLAAVRGDDGCAVTGDPSADFSAQAPDPRNTGVDVNPCAGTGKPVLSIADASIEEGDDGLTPLAFTVTLSEPAPAGGVAITASTADGSATAPKDYIALVDTTFGIDEGQTETTVTVQIVGDTEPEPDETVTVTIATDTPGIALGNATATGTIINDDLLTLEIFQIQGDGLRSPYAPPSGNDLGQTVTTEANVVTALADNGFFMQTPDARDDNDPLTSNGLFVFTGGTPSVVIGDIVDVTGAVQEYFDWTQLTSATVTVTGSGADLPTPVVLDEHTPSPDPDNLSCGDTNFECFENMFVHVAAGAVVQGNQRFASDLFAEAFVTASGERARREKGLLPSVTPPVPGLPVWDGNPEVFELDADGVGGAPIGTALFGGDLFEATGVIAYQFGNYALRPVELTLVEAEMPRPVPASGGDLELRVASFNVLNLCVSGCDPDKLARIAEYIGEVLALPDVIGLQELGSATAADQLAQELNTTYGSDYVGHIGSTPYGANGIRNGFLVRESRVETIRVRELDADVMIDQCSGTPPCELHDRPPLHLDARFSAGDDERFSVMNNHTRSLIGITDDGEAGERVRYKRFEQAKSIATLVQRFQDGEELDPKDPIGDIDTAQVPLILIGDYNAFEVTDGYVDVAGLIAGTYDNDENQYQLDDGNLVDPPLVNLILDVPLDDRYSYTFREDLGNILGEAPRHVGSVQILDQGLVNQAALGWCGGLVFGRGNADAPMELRDTGTGAVASSDHDGFIIRLFTDRLFKHDFEAAGNCPH